MKTLKIFGLYTIAVSASVLIVIDSGAFYDQYSDLKGIGYVQAGLLECFLAVTAGVWLTDDRFGLRNGIIKSLMVCLFLLSVASSAFKLALPEIETLSKLSTNLQKAEIIEKTIQEESKHQLWLKSQNQVTNTIVASRELRESRELLLNTLSENKSEWAVILKIGSLFTLKFLLQSANLCLFYLGGRLSREEEHGELKEAPPKEPTLKELFEESGMTKTEIAEKIGCSKSIVSTTINHYESVKDSLLSKS